MQDTRFSYSTQPHAAPVKRRAKYREEDDAPPIPINLMNDSRIVRGNTYAAKVMTNSLKREQDAIKSETERRIQTERLKKRATSGNRSSTPPPVEGRVHMDIQTDDFLEELTDRPVEMDAETQTQPFMDQPSSPLFVPAKTGQDVETQIEPDDLFDFDLEVEPILEVLVGKTIHVSMLELMQEEELEAIQRQQDEFEQIRNIELAEVQRLEADARRKAQEKERRLTQEKERQAEKIELEEKIAARSFAQQYLSSLHTGVFDSLQEEGFFYDPVKKEVEEVFMEEMLGGYKQRADLYSAAQLMAEELLNIAKRKAREFEVKAVALRQEREAVERERLRVIKEEEARLAAEAAKAAAEAEAEE
mmetsp:Transcript_28420/g.28727  ORF Transcript_28420/g.28727 Transcript_28420/m.28727 type:complete len:361 (+) Transcript_28420:162-1244(+)